MLTRFSDFDPTFSLFDELRRRMERVWEDFDEGSTPSLQAATVWPKVNLYDGGASFVLTADVPGLAEKDLQVTLHDGALTIAGERATKAPEGYAVHRQERGSVKFTRSLALPCKVDAENTTASVKDGVLMLTLRKAPEAQPRAIAIRAS
ncbi:MAG: Hsp20/alpha crystallin family protein [Myxococcales bacterium]